MGPLHQTAYALERQTQGACSRLGGLCRLLSHPLGQ
ncbi:ORFL88C.iORF1 [Human betaherpesvirus 5]|nr:ORFL88C.iORF1 [Human betaherpesvirus 5]QHX40397.1 ORFL88C.iORF1 [Human betaherpesvirus 5]